MDNYNTPIDEMYFALTRIADLDNFSAKTGNTDISSENVKLLLEEAGKFAKDLEKIQHSNNWDCFSAGCLCRWLQRMAGV